MFYGESADLFSSEIKRYLKPGNYFLADLGGHKGELLADILQKLPEYNFDSTIIDINEGIEEKLSAKKIIADITKIPFHDKSIDIVVVRYVLAWNSLEKQKEILKEISRITKGIAIIQHQGSSDENPQGLQNASDKLFDGEIPILKRVGYLFTEPSRIESWMQELGIRYERIQQRKIDGLSELFIEKFSLSDIEAQKTRDILAGNDYILQTTWVLKFD